MHKERTMRIFGNQLINLSLQNPQLHQPGYHDAHDFAGHLLNRGTRTEQSQAGLQRFQNDVINFTLGWRKFPVHRESTRDVARVTFIFTTCVDKH
ncbi:Uncharacterised protein [Salmonella enterica subsp. enterica serovar Bovismorbificans]|uniref:Uncharacterized protein n=1 Tax=Salmonella enterica subsp. enterica serovar Bovismorbificans TaxID=58097 RepID=A0A655EPN7_SALET|nr:Uncharacterised protein [Salmonella enterica subsp. enterica serovar Bovismorbificans]